MTSTATKTAFITDLQHELLRFGKLVEWGLYHTSILSSTIK
jgi:hypothetical protein